MRKIFLMLAILGIACMGTMTGTASAADVTWDGGNGNWAPDAKWNGGQTASVVLGSTGGVPSGYDVYINSGTVTYDPAVYGDWDVRIGSTINLSGATTVLTMDSDAGALDGYWSQFDGDAFNISNGATYSRGTTGGSGASGGPIMLGSWRAATGQKIAMNIDNGTFNHDGSVWFGAPSDNDPEIEVTMTITGGGSADLTGGNKLPGGLTNDDLLYTMEDLAFCYGHDGTSLKNEKYKVDFTGAGTLITDNGIIAPIQNADGSWTTNVTGSGGANTLLTYEQLFSEGILRARGASGGASLQFADYFTVSGTSGSANYTLTSTVPTATTATVVWDGGDGDWSASAKWNGGQNASAALGRTNGFEFGTVGEDGADIYINSGTVTYDTETYGDFRFRRAGTLNLSGATTVLQMDSTAAQDGKWAQWDAEALNISDGATFRRGYVSGGGAESGGILMFGSWATYAGQKMAINVSTGGTFENDGQVWFGAANDHDPGLEVTMTIDGGIVDLTGGADFTQTNDDLFFSDQDLALCYGHDGTDPKGEVYTINFTGTGSSFNGVGEIIVDNGIVAPVMDSAGGWTSSLIGGVDPNALLSYQDLWDNGVLLFDGLGAADGEIFSDYFNVNGTKNAANYTLQSLLPGDFDSDGDVDVSDLGILATDYGKASGALWSEGDANRDGVVDVSDLGLLATYYGTTAAAAAAAVPEPSMLMLLVVGGLTLISRRRR